MGKYADGLTISETTAGLVRAYDMAQKSFGIVCTILNDINSNNDIAAKQIEDEILPQYNAYVDAIFKALQCSVIENRGDRDSTKI